VSTAVQVLLIVLVGVVVGLVANILVSHTTFKVQELTDQQTALQDQRDRLSEDIAYRESPQNIASFAEENGMKRDTSPQFVDLSTADPAEESPVRIPGPRADAREDVRPNLRSPERLPVVGGDAGEFTAPAQTPPGG
jgi:Na+-transporting NADH:ubiquinone oxidoreductase subunit NqrC